MEDLKGDDPRTVGPYRVLQRIGSGGMGVVYLAEDPSGRRVALKLVRPELADDPAFRSRFRREVQAGQRVGGICTARYLDADLDSDHPYLVTEYVEGGNLADYVATHGPLTGEQLVGLAVGLAEAVVAIHASGVIHRDLKPTNVLMSPNGPKVVDFGISHAVEGTSLTQTGVIVGSPSWMAPEQAQGRETTPAVDVFSWGATVAFAATGRFPFGEGRPDAVIYRVVHEEPDLRGLDPKLFPMVAAALGKEPSARPSPDRLLVDVVKTAMAGNVPPGGSVAMTTLILDRTWVQEQPSKPTAPRGRQIALVAAAIIVIGAFIARALFVAHGDQSNNAPPHHGAVSSATQHSKNGASTTTSVPSATSTTALSSTASITADLPLVTCPTTYGSTQTTSPPALPQSMQVAVPQNLASQLAVYSDDGGGMKLVAPQGWICSASYGADGSGGVTVYPSGGSDVLSQSGPSPSDQFVMGSETSACASCREGQACPLFATAAGDYENDYQMTCSRPPSTESISPLSAGVVAYLVPPGTTGTGVTSPSNYPTNGVMTYYSGNLNGSWTDSCTLPSSEMSVCTVALNRFVDWYGNN